MGVGRRERFADTLDEPATLGPGPFVVRVIIAPKQAIGAADEVHSAQCDGVVGDRDVPLTHEIFTGAQGQGFAIERPPFLHLIHGLEHPGEPSALGLGDHELQIGVALEDAGPGQLQDRTHTGRHPYHRFKFFPHEKPRLVVFPREGDSLFAQVAGVAELPALGQVSTEDVEADRDSSLFDEAPERLVDLQAIRLPRHHAGQKECCETALDAAGRFGNRTLDLVHR